MSPDSTPTETLPPQAPSIGNDAGTSPNPHSHSHNFSFTFPIFFVTGDGSGSSDPQVAVPPEIRHLFSRLVQGMSVPFGPQQYEPVPSGPPKKHATQSALDKLKPVEVESLLETDRRCHICMQDYLVKQRGPRSPYVEDVKDEDDLDGGTTEGPQTAQKASPNAEEGEVPLQMPCGHVFGSTCLKEWLYQSPTCPLCRVEVESYTEEPDSSETPFMPWFASPAQQQQQQSESSDPMQVEPANSETGNTAPPQQPQPQFFPHIQFQFIVTPMPSPTPPPAATPNPQVSRSTPARSARHHPYSRSPAPVGPSVTDRPDLFCAQRGVGLCSHDISDENIIRLECGHAYHPDCLETSMVSSGYSAESNEIRCPRCRRWMSALQ